MHRLAGVLVLVATLACGEATPADEVEITNEELDVLTQVFLIEGALQDFTGIQRDTLAERYYIELYDKYGYDQQQLDAMRQRFSDNPVLWQAATDSVVARLEQARQDISRVLPQD